MRRRQFLTAGGALGVGTLAGCAGFMGGPPVDEVEMSITDVRTPSLGATTASLPVIMEFYNPADNPIPDPDVEFDLVIEDETVATVESALNTIDPGERVTESVEVIIKFGDVGTSVIDALRSGSMTLQLTGEITSEGATKSFSMETTEEF